MLYGGILRVLLIEKLEVSGIVIREIVLSGRVADGLDDAALLIG
jgi:hypothetical protein